MLQVCVWLLLNSVFPEGMPRRSTSLFQLQKLPRPIQALRLIILAENQNFNLFIKDIL